MTPAAPPPSAEEIAEWKRLRDLCPPFDEPYVTSVGGIINLYGPYDVDRSNAYAKYCYAAMLNFPRLLAWATAEHAARLAAERELRKWEQVRDDDDLRELAEQARDSSLAGKTAYINGLLHALAHSRRNTDQAEARLAALAGVLDARFAETLADMEEILDQEAVPGLAKRLREYARLLRASQPVAGEGE